MGYFMKVKLKDAYFDDTRILYIFKGILIGLLTGVVVSIFRLSIEFFSSWTVRFYEFAHKQPLWLLAWGALMLVFALILSLLMKSEPNIKGSGIPQVEGQLKGAVTIKWFSVLWKKFIGGIIAVGSGLFLGREGPSIQLGAAIGQGISEQLKSSRSEEKILISSGASAGLAAAFNAPIAGLLFVLEEVHHNFSPLVWLTAFSSALTANFVSLYFFGLKPVLYLGKLPSLPLKYYGSLILLGIVLGILGFVYQKVLLALPRYYSKLPIHPTFYGFVPFALILPIGYFFPHFLGGGNEIIVNLGTSSLLPLVAIVGIFFLRFLFSMVSYGSGLPGGIFLPILSLGALIGAIFGQILVTYFQMDPIFVKNFVIIAMAGYFTAIGKAPLTAIILVTEMVGSLNHLMPLGLVALIAYIINDLLGGQPIYESLLERLVKDTSPMIKGKKLMLDYPVTPESFLDGKFIRDINWPKDMLLVSIRRGAKELFTHGDTVMHAGDILVILVEEHNVEQIKKEIIKQSSPNMR